MKCACTLRWETPATSSESAELSCACPIFRCKKFAEPTRYVSSEDVDAMLHFLLDNVFIQVDGKVFQQCVGIPMGTNCALLLAELLLHDYESIAMIRFSRTNWHPQAKSFEFTRRYIDDLISVNVNLDSTDIEKIGISSQRYHTSRWQRSLLRPPN